MTELHRITAINSTDRTGTCAVCGPVRLRRRERRGSVEWSCARKHASYTRPSHRAAVSDHCAVCGYRALHASQLDVHHIDGDRTNNGAENLVTLCANCHRLFHALGPDGIAMDADRRALGDGFLAAPAGSSGALERALARLRLWDHPDHAEAA